MADTFGIMKHNNLKCFRRYKDPDKKINTTRMILLISTILIVGLMIYRSLEPAAAYRSINLAIDKMAYASSNENYINSSVNAFDGDKSTRWSSEYSDQQWIYVDLGSIQSVSSVVLNWEDAYAKQFQIEVSSDGFAWAVLYTQTNNTGGINVINFDSIRTRYVKMYAWQRATQYGYSLWEFEVYGSKQNVPAIKANKDDTEHAVSDNISKEQTKSERPFPQRLSYKGCIKPDNVTQEQMDDTIKNFYNYWKSKYVKPSNSNTSGGGYYIEMRDNSNGSTYKTMSSLHGYGMIIFSLMAGYDQNAKQYFDGMYNMYEKHRSIINKNNMSWIIDDTEDCLKDSDSSTDGDLDIAYSLLLAHYQWGSNGKINYYSEAKRIIEKGIKESEISKSTKRTLLGDWAKDIDGTRIADLMSGHFHAFFTATGDTFWKSSIDNVYSLIPELTGKYAPKTGLLPDFILNGPVRPATDNYIEGPMDGAYGNNSCIYPLRMAADYAHYGSKSMRVACSKIITWLKFATENNPSKIKTLYNLDGSAKDNESGIKYTAPFIVACIVDTENQKYLNEGWVKISNWKENCDGDSINLLSMLLISGNWWTPAQS